MYPTDADGPTSPSQFIRDGPGLQFPSGVTAEPARGEIYVSSLGSGTVRVYLHTDHGVAISPQRTIDPPASGLANNPRSIEFDRLNREFFTWVDNPAVVAHSAGADGATVPLRINSSSELGCTSAAIAVDPVRGWVAVSCSADTDDIEIYGADATGDATPLRTLANTALKGTPGGPNGVAFDLDTGDLFVAAAPGTSDAVYVFGPTADGADGPVRSITGTTNTGLDDPIDVAVDSVAGEIFVLNAGSGAITVYPIDADGDVAPLRTITNATGTSGANKLALY